MESVFGMKQVTRFQFCPLWLQNCLLHKQLLWLQDNLFARGEKPWIYNDASTCPASLMTHRWGTVMSMWTSHKVWAHADTPLQLHSAFRFSYQQKMFCSLSIFIWSCTQVTITLVQRNAHSLHAKHQKCICSLYQSINTSLSLLRGLIITNDIINDIY